MMNRKRLLPIYRILLCVLIVLNMAMIYYFSAEDGAKSGQTSGTVAHAVAEVTVRDFSAKPVTEQNRIVTRFQHPVRKAAHMAEHGLLALWIDLLLLTWDRTGSVRDTVIRNAATLTAVFLYACTDEWHQKSVGGRGAAFTDVLIDTAGAAVVCAVVFLILFLVRRNQRLRSVKKAKEASVA